MTEIVNEQNRKNANKHKWQTFEVGIMHTYNKKITWAWESLTFAFINQLLVSKIRYYHHYVAVPLLLPSFL